ncbi:MAG: LysR family transcriptional regulator [Rhizobiales bacterium]|nr:LysR family transcriptional regulator [Hyphomicrobiales bacterium]
MNWDDIKLFMALMRTGTVRAAAKYLGISHSTVARRIDVMEEKLAVRLFDRLPSGYVLTSVGEDMLQVAEQVEDELEGLERRILGQDHKLSGPIRVTMIDAFATNLLMPNLAAFAKAYPEIELEIEVSYESADLDYREADVALRFAQYPPEHLIGQRLLTCASAAYASKSYIEEHDPHDPNSACWIGFGDRQKSAKWRKQSPFPDIPVKGQFVSVLVQLEACKAGMGIGMLPCFLGDTEPSLCRLSPAKPDPGYVLWLLTHRDMKTNARLRAFSSFMASAIRSHRSQLEGQIDTDNEQNQ